MFKNFSNDVIRNLLHDNIGFVEICRKLNYYKLNHADPAFQSSIWLKDFNNQSPYCIWILTTENHGYYNNMILPLFWQVPAYPFFLITFCRSRTHLEIFKIVKLKKIMPKISLWLFSKDYRVIFYIDIPPTTLTTNIMNSVFFFSISNMMQCKPNRIKNNGICIKLSKPDLFLCCHEEGPELGCCCHEEGPELGCCCQVLGDEAEGRPLPAEPRLTAKTLKCIL